MNPAWIGCYIAILVAFFVIYEENQRVKSVTAKMIIAKRRKKEEKNQMLELAKNFIGRECMIYTLNSQLNGIIKEVCDGAILVEYKGNIEAVNLDFVTRIREYPTNKKGKKKSVVID
ncbi:MAG: hypothetical protein E7607_03655 [Ruminococcaceae bacterium]|nr:hypothetical protein [Oscillospiraceae bacterium]